MGLRNRSRKPPKMICPSCGKPNELPETYDKPVRCRLCRSLLPGTMRPNVPTWEPPGAPGGGDGFDFDGLEYTPFAQEPQGPAAVPPTEPVAPQEPAAWSDDAAPPVPPAADRAVPPPPPSPGEWVVQDNATLPPPPPAARAADPAPAARPAAGDAEMPPPPPPGGWSPEVLATMPPPPDPPAADGDAEPAPAPPAAAGPPPVAPPPIAAPGPVGAASPDDDVFDPDALEIGEPALPRPSSEH